MTHLISDQYKAGLSNLMESVGELAAVKEDHLKKVGQHTQLVLEDLCAKYTSLMVETADKYADCMPKRDIRIKELIGNLIGETAAHTSVSIQMLDVNGIPNQGEEMLSETIEEYVHDHRNLIHQLWTDINT